MPDEHTSQHDWLTIKAAAHHISASPSFVRKLIALGRLPAANISAGNGERAEWRIKRADLETFMAASVGATTQEVRP